MVVEDKIVEILLDQNHFFLILGIFGFLYFIRAVNPIAAFLFSPKWRWLIPIINLGLAGAGIFVLNMTSATTTGMKLVIMFLVTAVTTYGYELTKPLIKKILEKIFGKDISNDFFSIAVENKSLDTKNEGNTPS